MCDKGRKIARTTSFLVFFAVFCIFSVSISFAYDNVESKARIEAVEEPALAINPKLESIITGLQKRYESIDTFKARFTQETFTTAMATTESVAGDVYFKKPGRMRWDYDNDEKVVSNGKFIWVFQPDLGQVIETDVTDSSANLAMDFLSGLGDIKKDFKVELAHLEEGSEKESKNHRLKLTPRKELANIQKLYLDLSKKFEVLSTVLHDHFGNETTVSFEEMEFNKVMKAAFFEKGQFKGARIVRP